MVRFDPRRGVRGWGSANRPMCRGKGARAGTPGRFLALAARIGRVVSRLTVDDALAVRRPPRRVASIRSDASDDTLGDVLVLLRPIDPLHHVLIPHSDKNLCRVGATHSVQGRNGGARGRTGRGAAGSTSAGTTRFGRKRVDFVFRRLDRSATAPRRPRPRAERHQQAHLSTRTPRANTPSAVVCRRMPFSLAFVSSCHLDRRVAAEVIAADERGAPRCLLMRAQFILNSMHTA